MTVDEASEILHARLTQGIIIEGPDLFNAIKLGAEALKGLSFLRTNCGAFPSIRLPGETE